jgi:hypothetical protein
VDCLQIKLKAAVLKILALCLLFLYVPRAFAAVIVAVNATEGVIYADLQPSERTEYTKGDSVSFVLMPERGTRYSGKITDVIQGRRLVIDVEGGAYYMRLGAPIELRRKQSVKKFGRKNSIINRGDDLYQSRRNISAFGGALSANSKVSFSESLLLYGGGLGVSLPWDTEAEGHFWMSGEVKELKYTVSMRVMGADVKKFFSNAFYGFGGLGYRSTTVSLNAKKKADSETAPADETATTTGDEPEIVTVTEHYSDDIVLEFGLGARIQLPTLIIGKSMIFGVDTGFWYLASILDSTPELNLELDYAYTLPTTTFFARAYAGFGF